MSSICKTWSSSYDTEQHVDKHKHRVGIHNDTITAWQMLDLFFWPAQMLVFKHLKDLIIYWPHNKHFCSDKRCTGMVSVSKLPQIYCNWVIQVPAMRLLLCISPPSLSLPSLPVITPLWLSYEIPKHIIINTSLAFRTAISCYFSPDICSYQYNVNKFMFICRARYYTKSIQSATVTKK